MSFADFFRDEKKSESVVLIDIGAGSVAGAYAQYVEGELPAILYTARLPIEPWEDELHEKAMLRALQALGDTLIREGAPALARATGSGSASAILVSIDAPWQKTSVRTEVFEQGEPFTFTRSLVAAALKETSVAAPGQMLADESIIGTILNGYETNDPYGKRAHRASVVVLSSFIDEAVANNIIALLRGIYHTKRILPIAGSSLRFQAMQRAFPHERDALIFDATGPQTSVALLRKGLFVSISEVPATDTVEDWVVQVGDELAKLAGQYPLPRTIFLLARESEVDVLRQALDTTDLAKLWLSDNPPKIVSVLASHIIGLVRQATTTPPDLLLLLMALFHHKRDLGGEAAD
ncbi:hypothetical protein KGQ72_00340 [Patescibacteria group bacterium]|nr:hypothetical protein [Patescibacteria group bacterium]